MKAMGPTQPATKTPGAPSVVSDVGRTYLRLQLTSEVGPIRLRKLTAHFGSLDAVLGASQAALQQVAGIGPRIAESIFRSRNHDQVDRVVDRSASLGIRIFCLEDDDYPKPLLNIADPPICLYIRGLLRPTDAVALAVVGTRRCSHYGREQAARFSKMLARAGFTVVSGLARGIDGQAHRGALRAGGRTIAVLGNGLATVYPQEHEALAEEIAEAGALLSELPPDFAPDAKNFPPRNRIIIGLSLGVIVIEAGKRSGALITARLASEYNREVFAVPGRVDQPDRTAGCHSLIRDGHAKLVTCLEDVLDELAEVGDLMRPLSAQAATETVPTNKDSSSPLPPGALAEPQRMVYEAITEGREDPDGICQATSLPMGQVMSTLTALQLQGLVRCLPGGRFVPRRKNANG